MRRPAQAARHRAGPGPLGRRGRPGLVLVALLLGTALALHWPRSPSPLDLAYEIDLSTAATGTLRISLVLAGDLPGTLDLDFPPGIFARDADGLQPRSAEAWQLGPDGVPLRRLGMVAGEDGWRITGVKGHRLGFTYDLALGHVPAAQADIRRHISAAIPGGWRAAGYEVFVQPGTAPVRTVAVGFRNPNELPLVVPWTGSSGDDGGTGGVVALFRPRDARDLNNALFAAASGLRVHTIPVTDVRLSLATAYDWFFTDEVLARLLRRVAAAEIAFFGDAPRPLITCLVAPNPVTGSGRFDVYGAHTGSSLILWLDPTTTHADLLDSATPVVAHEMFHGWLGEAIRQQEPETLWFTEGATSLYAVRMLVAAGVWSSAQGEANLAARLDRDLWHNSAHGSVAIADAAAMVMADPATVRLAYAGGIAACAALDRWLAENGAGTAPLDEVLRHLYAHRDQGPLTRTGLEAAITAVTGLNAAPWLAAHVYGREPLPPIAPVL